MKFQLLGDRVLIRPTPTKTETSGGILLPEVYAEPIATTGEIVQVGEGPRNGKGVLLAHTVELGQQVVFSNTVGQVIELDGEDFLIVPESHILAVLGEE